MALPSPDLLEEVLVALNDWEWILHDVYHQDDDASALTDYDADLAASRRFTNEACLWRAQQRRAAFLRSPAAKYFVPAPFSLTYWYDEPRTIDPGLKVIRKRGASKRLRNVPCRPKWLRRRLDSGGALSAGTADSGRLGMVEAVTGWLGENAPTDSGAAPIPAKRSYRG